jgi:ABC-type phosphate transport system substrate-binding protein
VTSGVEAALSSDLAKPEQLTVVIVGGTFRLTKLTSATAARTPPVTGRARPRHRRRVHAKDIFTGVDSNWSQVGGSSLSSTIDPVGRNSSAGSYTFFQSAVLGGATQSSNVHPVTSDGLVATAVHSDPNAIGYVGLAHSGASSGVKKVSLNGVACNDANIKKETYPLFRFIWGVVPTSHPSKQVEQFFDWVRTSKAAGKIIASAGAVPAFNK